MTQLEILDLLEQTMELSFLDSILVLKKTEKEYNSSDFYKTTRIPLLELYKNYFEYYQSRYGLEDKINELVNSLDENLVSDKIEKIVTKVMQSPFALALLEKVKKEFNLESLLDNSEELKQLLKDFPK